MFLNVLFYAFSPDFESNLGCFSALFLVRFRGVFRGHLYWRNVYLKHTCTFLCSLLLCTDLDSGSTKTEMYFTYICMAFHFNLGTDYDPDYLDS